MHSFKLRILYNSLPNLFSWSEYSFISSISNFEILLVWGWDRGGGGCITGYSRDVELNGIGHSI